MPQPRAATPVVLEREIDQSRQRQSADRAAGRHGHATHIAQITDGRFAADLQPDDEEENRHCAVVDPVPDSNVQDQLPTVNDVLVVQKFSYPVLEMLAQMSAATDATSSNTAPPASLARNCRSVAGR